MTASRDQAPPPRVRRRPSRRRTPTPVNHERWMVSYADFVTLLFAFFTTLYAISKVNLSVAYPLAAVSARFRPLFILNPLSAIVEGFRSSLVFDRAPDWPLVATSAAITVAVFAAAFASFKRMDKYFADVI